MSNVLPAKYIFTIWRGATFRKRLRLTSDGTPWDLSEYTGTLVIFANREATSPLLTLTTENNGITLDDEGNIELFISASVTETLTWNHGIYELKIVEPGEDIDDTIPLLWGPVRVKGI